MKIRMLVSISRDDFTARIGQELDLDTALAHALIGDAQAVPLDTIVLPRVTKPAPEKRKGVD